MYEHITCIIVLCSAKDVNRTREGRGKASAPVSQVRITTADNFGLWPQRVKTRDAFILRADGVLTAFIELEATISTHSLGRTNE